MRLSPDTGIDVVLGPTPIVIRPGRDDIERTRSVFDGMAVSNLSPRLVSMHVYVGRGPHDSLIAE
jgi:hypothetical protein